MSLDFSSQEDRLSYLNEKLDDILDGINTIYGSALTDELVTRMERTIIDFNDEILEIMGEIKHNADKKNQLLHDIIDGNVTLSKPSDVASTSKNGSDNLSAWEKKLEGL